MKLPNITGTAEGFDMTPVIDVVFLLIIFFMLVCQFMAAENFTVQVPEEIASAQGSPHRQELLTTVTVMQDSAGQVQYAVGSEPLPAGKPEVTAGLIAEQIDVQLQQIKPDQRIVRLRCDKTLPFGKIKHALEGISQSSATDIQWAVFGKD